MWRSAHGRLAAIVVLAGGLFSCLPEPRRPPPLQEALENAARGRAEDEEDRRRHPFVCGGNHDFDNRSPDERKRDFEREVTGFTSNCVLSLPHQKYGEVRVTWSQKDGVSVDLTGTHGLTEDDRRCVEAAARNAAPVGNGGYHRGVADWVRDFPEGLTIYTSFGKPPPLLPPMPDFAADWQAATTSPEARARLLASLPDEAALEDDGCISFPLRPAFLDRLTRWLQTAGARPNAFWGRDLDAHDDVFAGFGVKGQEDAHAYVLPNISVIVERTPWPPRPRFANAAGHEVCLLKWDRKLQQELRARIEQRATCMTGDLGEILVHPLADVPAGRPFLSVAVGPTRVCALDGGGRLSCCGQRTPQDIPAAAFTSVAVGMNFDCGVTVAGDLYCWGSGAPAYGSMIKGPFAQVTVAPVYNAMVHVCAIRRDTRALECWNPDAGRMVTASAEKVRSAVLDGWGVCALLEAGPVLCRESKPGDKWRRLKAQFRGLVAINQYDVCGVPDAGGGVACVERYPEAPRPQELALLRPPPAPEPMSVAISGGDGCVVDRSGRLTCWPVARNRWSAGFYRAVAASGDRFCAVTIDGRVKCDRYWPSGAPTAAFPEAGAGL